MPLNIVVVIVVVDGPRYTVGVLSRARTPAGLCRLVLYNSDYYVGLAGLMRFVDLLLLR